MELIDYVDAWPSDGKWEEYYVIQDLNLIRFIVINFKVIYINLMLLMQLKAFKTPLALIADAPVRSHKAL